MIEEDASLNEYWKRNKHLLLVDRASYWFYEDHEDIVQRILKEDYDTFKDKACIDYKRKRLCIQITLSDFISESQESSFIVDKKGIDKNGYEVYEVTYYDDFVE